MGIAVALFLCAAPSFAQSISYLVPDIGAPGMSTLVEIIAPHSANRTFPFGTDLYLGGQIVVEPATAADTARVVISPPIVSWDGRLISCHVFVKPGASNGSVPLRVRWGTTTTTSASFSIVTPQAIGARSGGGVIGSGGTWGTRSARGAMIVDSLVLSNGTYSFATTDPDATTSGNQGFLPAIVLSRGRIVVNSDAVIEASASGKHGGPGGGGGGGYGPGRVAFPAIPGERDAPQGDGFVGGASAVPIVPSPGPFGTGTGASSKSLNDVETNTAFRTGATSVRLYGSGPGHPFDSDGRSGGAAAIGAAPPAIFGSRYGAGGNATAGSGITDFTDVNGQVIGNRHLVPLHGGGGGASGGSNDSVGGGGGGAVALYSMSSASVASARTRGGAGRNGCNNCGTGSGDASAGGAGGGVIIGARIGLDVAAVDVSGGAAGTNAGGATTVVGTGGVGRFRHDGRLRSAPTVTTNASRYVGPTLDTLTFADSVLWTVRGTGRPSDSVSVLVRTENTGWSSAGRFSTVVATDSTWSVRVRFPVDTIAFVCVAQKVPTGDASTGAYTATPSHVYSQVGASIVRLNLYARIDADRPRRMDSVHCPQARFDTVTVRNRGTAPLALQTATRFLGTGASLFSVVAPTLPDSIDPGDSVRLIVRFDGANAPDGRYTVILRIASNDRDSAWYDIAYEVVKEGRRLSLDPPTIDLGDVQVGVRRDTSSTYRNGNSYRDTITSVDLVSGTPGFLLTAPTAFPQVQNGGAQRVLGFAFTPTDTGAFTARWRVRTQPCGRDTFITITGYARSPIIRSKRSIEFPGLACADTADELVVVRNTGNAPMVVQWPTLQGSVANFTIVSPSASTFPRTIAVRDSVVFVVRARNSTMAPVSAQLVFLSNDSLPGDNPWIVQLSGDRDPIVFETSDTLVSFGTVCVGSRETRGVSVLNRSQRSVIQVVGARLLEGLGPFRFDPLPGLPFSISGGGDIQIPLTFAPVTPGDFLDTIEFRAEPCGRMRRVIVQGTAIRSDVDIAPTPVDFGDLSVGTSALRTIVLANPGTTATVVTSAQLVRGAVGMSIVWPTFPPTRTLQPGDTMHIVVRFAPTVQGGSWDSVRIRVSSPCPTEQQVPLSGNGIRSSLALTRSSLQFLSPACAPPADVEDTLTLRNTGTARVVINRITASPLGRFAVVAPTSLPLPLDPGATVIVRARYAPAAASATPSTGGLRFETSDPERPDFTVTLIGRRDSAAVSVWPQNVLFPTIARCEPGGVQTLRLRNDGTLTDTVRFSSWASFTLEPPPPYRIAPGRDTVVTIRFVATDTGVHRSVVTLEESLCRRQLTVIAEARREGAGLSSSSIDFGDVPVAGLSRMRVPIANRSTVAARITGAAFVPPLPELTVDPGQLPLRVGPGSSVDLSVTYSPTAAGDLPAGTRLVLLADSLCSDSLALQVRGRGMSGSLAVGRGALEFGSLLECLDRIDSVGLRNAGSAPVTIASAALAGPSASSFTAVAARPLPHVLVPGDTLLFSVRFAPTAAPDGPRTASLEIATSDPLRPVVSVPLSGERLSESLSFSASPFPTTAPGSTSLATGTVSNTGTAPVRLTSVTVPPPFSVRSTTPPLPVDLAPGATVQVELGFAPTTGGDASEVLSAATTAQCVRAFDWTVSARATSPATASLSLPIVEARPGQTVRIPVTLSTSLGLADAAADSVTIVLRLNRTLLLPTGSPGQIDGSDRIVVLGARRSGMESGELVVLEGIAALGDTSETRILVDSVQWHGTAVATSTAAGLLRIVTSGGWVSFQGGEGLELGPVSPNPTDGAVDLAYRTIEPGRTVIVVRDLLGRLLTTLLDEELPPGPGTLRFDTVGMPTGHYLLELRTPGGRLGTILQVAH